MSDAVLGIDLGTSAVKSVVCRDGRIVAMGSAPLEVSSPKPGWSEQDPGDWVGAVRASVAEALSGARGVEIAGVGLSGQMHGAVLLDAAGAVLRPAILWNDNRSTDACEVLAERFPEIGEVAGVPPLPGFTAPKLIWVKEAEPQVYAQIATVLLPKDYVGFWLTGVRATDRSDAAGTLWLDQEKRVWDARLAEASDTDPDWLPELHYGHEQVGALTPGVAEELGLPAGIPVFAGGGDAATGAISLGAASPGKCFMSLGTSGQLLVVDKTYRPNPAQFVHAFCHTVPEVRYRMAAMLNGARPMSWFAKVLGCSVPEMLSAAAEADQSRIPVFLPYLNGERSPHGDPDIRGGFYGLDGVTGRGELSRAVVEAVAFMMRDAVDSFGESFQPSGPIPVIGGGSQSDQVLQVLADVLHHPVARSDAGKGGAAFGAALLAEVGIGARALSELAFDPQIGDVFEPKGSPGLAQRLDRYRGLYQALKAGI